MEDRLPTFKLVTESMGFESNVGIDLYNTASSLSEVIEGYKVTDRMSMPTIEGIVDLGRDTAVQAIALLAATVALYESTVRALFGISEVT